MAPNRMKVLICLLGLCAAAGPLRAQPAADETFAVTPIQHLLAGDDAALVRLEERRFVVDGPGRATETVRRVVTVLRADGREAGRLLVPYDKLRRLRKVSGLLRDASGKVVRRLRDADTEDYSAISDGDLYVDMRFRTATLYHEAYPYTVEYAYEILHDGLIGWPAWYPQGRGEAVEYAAFEVDAPAGMAVRHRTEGLDLEPEVSRTGNRQKLRWHVRMRPPFAPEPYGPTPFEQTGAVHVGPERFEIEGTAGEMGSWAAFGRWYAALARGRQTLPPDVVAEVRALVADAPDDREKARRLYAYLQARTRYVSVQLGLGGWQPFDAAYVQTRGYGDCKALTNYMQTLLAAAGITAYPALISSGVGQPEVLADFPSNQFNHVILFVPLDGDTLWLENTSQTIPFGHLGAANEDRYALVVRPDGGELVRTPRSRAADNRQVREGRVVLTPEGHAAAEVQTTYTGNRQDRVRWALARASGRDREEWLHDNLGLPSFEVVRTDFASVEAGGREVQLPLALRLPRYGSRTGTRLFFRPCLMDAWTTVPPAVEARTQPVHLFSYAFTHVDSLHYVPPPGFTVEALPAPVALETPFGRYDAVVSVEDDGTLVYRRRFEVTETKLPPDEYDAVRDFLRQVAQADRAQVVLVSQ